MYSVIYVPYHNRFIPPSFLNLFVTNNLMHLYNTRHTKIGGLAKEMFLINAYHLHAYTYVVFLSLSLIKQYSLVLYISIIIIIIITIIIIPSSNELNLMLSYSILQHWF